MPTAWRMIPKVGPAKAFDGEGARLYGGRWNSPGRAVIYTGGSRALAALEVLVHLNPSRAQQSYLRFAVTFGEDLVHTISTRNIDSEMLGPTVQPETQILGDEWARKQTSPVLRIPSAIIPEENDYLLNPFHPDFAQLSIGSPEVFSFDPRLLPC